MANTDKLSAEIQLDIKAFNLGVAGVIRSTETIENAFEKLSQQMEKNLTKGFDQLGKQIDRIKFDGVSKGVDDLNKKLTSISLDQLASKLTAASDQINAAFGTIVGESASFEAALRRVNTIFKANDADLAAFGDSLSKTAQDLGVGVGPTETLAGAYEILSARTEDAAGVQQILATALVASSAASVPTAASVDVLTSVLNSYGLAAKDATLVSDVLFKTADIGKTTFEQLAPVIGNVAPLASSTGVSIQELGGAIAILTKSGIKTPTAIESIRAVIAALGAPTQEAKKAAAEFGLTLDDSFLKSRGLANALQEITRKTGGSASAIRKILGDVSGFNAALKLTAGNGKEFAEAIAANFNAAGSSANAAAQRQKTFEASMERLKAAGQELAISFGDQLLPALKSAADSGAKLANAFSDIPDVFKQDILVIGGVVSAVGLLGGAIATLANVLPFVAGGWGLVAAGITSAGVSLGVLAPAAEVTTGALLGLEAQTAILAGTANVTAASLLNLNAQTASLALGCDLVAGSSVGATAGVTGLGVAAKVAAAGMGIIVGVATAAALAIQYMGEAINDSEKAQQKYIADSSKALVGFGTAMADSKKTVNELADTRSLKDLEAEMLSLREAAEDVRERFNKGLLGKEDADRQVNDINAALQRLRDSYQQVKDIQAVRAPKVESTAAVEHTSLKEQKEAAKEQAKLLRQRVAEEIAAVTNSKKGDNDKILALRKLLQTEKLRYNERIHIETLISNLEKKHIKDKQDAAKKAGEETFKQELQNVQHSKKGIDDQIALLETLAQKYASNGDKRRKIEDELSKLKDKKAKEDIDRIQAIADAEAKAADIRKQASEGRTVDLERQQERGVDVTEQLIEERRKQGEEQIKELQKKLEEELSKPGNKDKKIQVALKSNTKAEIDNVNATTERDVRGIQERTAQDRAALAAEEVESAKRVGEAKLEALRREQAEGKTRNAQIEEGILAQLALEEQGIQQAANSAKAATDNANKQRQIELQAQLDIQAARQRATDQLEEQNRLLDEQKKKQEALKEKGPIQGGSGFAFTLGGRSTDINDRSAFESSGTGDFAARQAKTAADARKRRNIAITGLQSPEALRSKLDTLKPREQVLKTFADGTVRTPSLTPKQAKAVGSPGAAAVHVSFAKAQVEIIQKDASGKEIGRKTVPLKPTGDGRTSDEDKFARRFSGKHGNNTRT